MVANPLFDLLAPVRPESGGGCDSALPVETPPPASAECELSEERAGEPVTYPDWRIEELARKYSDEQHEERYERGFYHPFG